MSDSDSKNDEVSLNISDVYAVAKALETAIKNKAFDKDSTVELYPVWNRVMRFCEEVKRRSDINSLYSAGETQVVADDVPTPTVVEITE